MNAVNWFEIAVTDIERAKGFYEKVFKVAFDYMEMGDTKMYSFKGDSEKHGSMGCIFQSDKVKPSAEGTTVYFSTENCDDELNRVEASGGKVIFPKTSIGDHGFISQVIDTEGNRIGIHSRV
jgi:predicted enzyme related to lactoylglutathione lyase